MFATLRLPLAALNELPHQLPAFGAQAAERAAAFNIILLVGPGGSIGHNVIRYNNLYNKEGAWRHLTTSPKSSPLART
jgi:hypothetical protein